MNASFSHQPLSGGAYQMSLEDWDLLFEAVMTRLQNATLCQAEERHLFPVVLECYDTLEQLRRLHPLMGSYVR